jgi:hypothetical protein
MSCTKKPYVDYSTDDSKFNSNYVGGYMNAWVGEVGRDNYSELDNLMSEENHNRIREKVAWELSDIYPQEKGGIHVTNRVIDGVLVNLYKDGYSKNIYDIIDQAIYIIAESIRIEHDTIKQNWALDKWVIKYGSNDQENRFGLAAHSKIKLKLRRPATMQFNMRY